MGPADNYCTSRPAVLTIDQNMSRQLSPTTAQRALRSAIAERLFFALLIEYKLFGVQERPDDVFVSQFFVLSMLGDVVECHGHLAGSRLMGEGPQEQLFDFLSVRPRVFGQGLGATARPAQLPLNLIGIQQVQGLGQVRLADALALTGTESLRPAKNIQEVRGERF